MAAIDEPVDTAERFFRHVLTPNCEQFGSSRTNYAAGFNAALSAFHMRDWVFRTMLSEAESYFGCEIKDEGALWGEVERRLPQAGYVRDIANASKHFSLKHRPSTELRQAGEVQIKNFAYGEGSFGSGRYSAPNLIIPAPAGDVYFEHCLTEVYELWRELIYPTAATI
jgi:hypothetical protein